MWRWLLLLGVCLPVRAQQATFNNFSDTVKGITVGQDHCYFWFHVVDGWDMEVACYRSGKFSQWEAALAGEVLEHSMVTPEGTFAWVLRSSPEGTVVYQLTGHGPGDTIDMVITGTS